MDDLLAFESEPAYGKYLGMPQPYRRSDAERRLASWMLSDWTGQPRWAIELAGQAIGHVGMTVHAVHGRVDLYYGLAPAHWGKGYMTEAVRAAIDAAFTSLPQANRVQADANPSNVASLRVMEKAGMRREGVLRSYVVIGGKAADQVMCSIVRSDWEAAR